MFSNLFSKMFGRGKNATRLGAAVAEALEDRTHYAFNAYVAGPASAPANTSVDFVFSTTGQAAKQFSITWEVGGTPQIVNAPDPLVGFTAPKTVPHTYTQQGTDQISVVATSITNVTTSAVLQLNKAWTGVGANGAGGKTVQGLADANGSGTSIASVEDASGRTYVLSVDLKQMAVTRFTTGQIDTAWNSTGTYVLPSFTSSTIYDMPKAMVVDTTNNALYVAGGSNNKWAVARVNIAATPTIAWQKTILTGTANGLWLDSSDGNEDLGVAGTATGLQIQVAVLQTGVGAGQTGGDFVTDFGPGGVGYATASNSIYGLGTTFTGAYGTTLVELDDINPPNGEDEWLVAGTVTYCCSGSGLSGSDMVIVDFLPNGTTDTTFGNGSGAALFNTSSGTAVGTNYDACNAMVASGTTLTLVGSGAGKVLAEQFTTSSGAKNASFGSAGVGYVFGPNGAGYAAVGDSVGNFIISGGGVNDFPAIRLGAAGTLDTSFGNNGVISIDFGSTSGVTTDGGRSVVLRNTGGSYYDILVAGYTYDSATSKYKIALVDLLEENVFHVT